MSKNTTIIAIAVVAIVVVAAACVFLMKGPDNKSEGPGFRTDFAVGDYIVLGITEDDVSGIISRTVIDIFDDGHLLVAIEGDWEYPSSIVYSPEQFATYMTTQHTYPTDIKPETVTHMTQFGSKELQRYTETVDGSTFITYIGDGVVYKDTEVTSDGEIKYSVLLYDTSLLAPIDEILRDTPKVGELRVEPKVGDNIILCKFSRIGSGSSVSYESFTEDYVVGKINPDGTLLVTKIMNGFSSETMTVEEYIGLVQYDGVVDPNIPFETLNTKYGPIKCQVVEENGVKIYVGEDGVIYKTDSGPTFTVLEYTTLFDAEPPVITSSNPTIRDGYDEGYTFTFNVTSFDKDGNEVSSGLYFKATVGDDRGGGDRSLIIDSQIGNYITWADRAGFLKCLYSASDGSMDYSKYEVLRTETIDTAFGKVQCTVYDGYSTEYYVDGLNKVLYKKVTTELDGSKTIVELTSSNILINS